MDEASFRYVCANGSFMNLGSSNRGQIIVIATIAYVFNSRCISAIGQIEECEMLMAAKLLSAHWSEVLLVHPMCSGQGLGLACSFIVRETPSCKLKFMALGRG